MDLQRTFQGLTNSISNIPSFFTKSEPLIYNQKISTSSVPTKIPNVPDQYQDAVRKASVHSRIPESNLSAQFNSENGGNWDPKLRGRADPTDFGVTQLNPIAIQTITGKNGGRNYFRDNYGQEFNPADANHQILAAGIYLNYLRQFALPAAGIKNPTDQDVMTAYNTGAQGYANAKNGDQAASKRARNYQSLLTAHGAK